MTRRFLMSGLAAAALIPLVIGVGVAVSAPSAVVGRSQTVSDSHYQPGMDGIDLAAVTGPTKSATGRVPACADPARRGDLRPCRQ